MSKGRPKIDRERQRLEYQVQKGKDGLLACYEILEEIREKVDKRQAALDAYLLEINPLQEDRKC